MDIEKIISQKTVSAEEAISKLRNGSRIFISSGCGEPRHLIRTMIADKRVKDIMIYQMLAIALEDYLKEDAFTDRFLLKLFYVTAPMRETAFDGKFDYIPVYLSEVPSLFKSNQIGLNAALIQISPPDRFGCSSLGVSVDVTREAVRCADLVIAQVNPKMPRTHGEGFLQINDIDYLVPFEEDLSEIVEEKTDEWVTSRIAKYVSELIDDGSTLQVGYGFLPYRILPFLSEKNDLGVHTHMMFDAFLPLYTNGNITNKRKNFFRDRSVATFCMGSRAIYDYIDNNPGFYFGTADFVNSPRTIARNNNFISIGSAMEVDLTGQVCSDLAGRYNFSGTGDQSNFIRGAALSKNGFSIIALPSTSMDGKHSQIVAKLSEGAGLASLRADVNFVVTEYGIAQLKGKSIYQRVIELAQIAHPNFRQELIDQAKEHRYIFADQLPPRPEDLFFLESYKTRVYLKNRRLLSVRPLLPSDEIAYRNFFYSLKEETVYLRFFNQIDVFSHKMAQAHWFNLDYRNSITLIGLVRNRGNKEIVAIATYAGMKDGIAEIAFVVREDFQGMGVAGILLENLEKIARENGGKGFLATTLKENKAMQHLLLKRYPDAKVEETIYGITITMTFGEILQNRET